MITVRRIVAAPVGSNARYSTPHRLVGVTASGSPAVRSASGTSTTVAQTSPAAAKLNVLTGGHSRVTIDPHA